MNVTTAILEIEQEGEMFILKPVMELHDLDELEMDEAAHELLEHMENSGVADVFLDLHNTHFARSQATQLAFEFCKCVRSQGGSLAIGLI
jgi:anti-anti-sigma regulatory factor